MYKANKGFGSKLAYGMILKYSGDLEWATGNLPGALRNYRQTLNTLDPELTDTLFHNPIPSGLQNLLFPFETLISKAAALHAFYNQQSGIHFLEQSVQTYSSALLLVKHIERTYSQTMHDYFSKQK